VDELEGYAKLSGLNRRIGRNQVQHVMALAFSAPSIVPDTEQFDSEVGGIVRQWELNDSRDSWKWTDTPQPPAHVRNSDIGARSCSTRPTPQATVDAFCWLKLWKAK
jgi:hypothetical protein